MIHSSKIRRQCAVHRQREPCFICGKHKTITEAHHIMPLKDVALLLESWGCLDEPPIIWLCPNCHSYIHSAQPFYLPTEQLKRYLQISEMKYDYLASQILKGWPYG